jgi:HAD superfamily hydrolase (TIGR01509 family)
VITGGVTATRGIVERWLTSSQPAVIFDFNGTLSDDEPILFDIFSDLFATHLHWEMTADEYRDDLLGHSDREIVQAAVARQGGGGDMVDELLRLRRTQYKERVRQHNPILPATLEMVRQFVDHRIPMGIVTGAQRGDVIAVLDSSPAGSHINVLVAEEDVAKCKPDPEGFLSGARQLRRRPSDILVFEDSVPGVRAALAARMQCIAVNARPSAELLSVAPAVVGGLSAQIVSEALTRRN